MDNIVAIRHVVFENMGILEDVLRERQQGFHYIDAPMGHFNEASPEQHDLLVVLGGPTGAFDEESYPFLRDELNLLQQWLDSGKPILGICLGAQLLARLLGAEVKAMAQKEIGYALLQLNQNGHASPLRHLEGVPVLHWHGDAFSIPNGAALLAASPLCPHQAFSVGQHILALQFHLEARAEQIEYWLVGHACELAQAKIAPQHIRAQAKEYGAMLQQAAKRSLSDWLDGCLQTCKPVR